MRASILFIKMQRRVLPRRQTPEGIPLPRIAEASFQGRSLNRKRRKMSFLRKWVRRTASAT